MTRSLSWVVFPLELSFPIPDAQPGETSDKFDCIHRWSHAGGKVVHRVYRLDLTWTPG
jgi:hypothetical protein